MNGPGSVVKINKDGRLTTPVVMLDALVGYDSEIPVSFSDICPQGSSYSVVIYNDRSSEDESPYSRLLLYNSGLWDRYLSDFAAKKERIARLKAMKALRADYPDAEDFELEDMLDESAVGDEVDSEVRSISLRSKLVRIDSQGRMTLPFDFCENAGILSRGGEGGEVVFIPLRDKIELWSADAPAVKPGQAVSRSFRH
ncbi:MAG: division/cell wall cluster transcriptional repressor MraZ [Clostridia bacterium]|nr:division/cell wall cluster transcriptional repressor MraZ [Clostridia bacterium]